MTQPEQAVADEPIIAAEPTIEDRFAAIADEESSEEPKEPEEPEGSEEAPEEIEEPELEADDVEEEDVQPIQAPTSWPDEDKEAFAELPRNVQERISAREAERERFIQTKSREAKQAEQRVFDQAVQTIRGIQEAQIQQITSLLPQIPEEPSAHLLTVDPNAYAQAVDERRWALGQHQYAQQKIAEIQAGQQQIEQTQKEQTLQSSIELLQEKFPEFLDDTARPELIEKITSTGMALGYSQDQLNEVAGEDILALRQASEWKTKAEKYDVLMSKKMERVRQGKNPPRISRPGSSGGKGAVANQRYTADRQAMREGDRDAAIRVFDRFT